MNRLLKFAAGLIRLVFVISTALLLLWTILGPLYRRTPGLARGFPISWTRTHRLPLSRSTTQRVSGTEQVAIFSDGQLFVPAGRQRKNLGVLRISLSPVYGKEVGADGKPLIGLYDPQIAVYSIELRWIVLAVICSTLLLLILAKFRRSNDRRLRGFPVDVKTP